MSVFSRSNSRNIRCLISNSQELFKYIIYSFDLNIMYSLNLICVNGHKKYLDSLQSICQNHLKHNLSPLYCTKRNVINTFSEMYKSVFNMENCISSIYALCTVSHWKHWTWCYINVEITWNVFSTMLDLFFYYNEV